MSQEAGPSTSRLGWSVSIELDRVLLDAVSGTVWEHAGVCGIEERPTGDPTRVTMAVGLSPGSDPGPLVAVLGGFGAPAVEEVVDGAWRDGWMAHARPVRVGKFLVVPDWVDGDPGSEESEPADTVEIRLPPGRAFGTGGHPTTAMVMERLASRVRPGCRVLDVGCGSGLLAVAAALLGGRVTAIDIDPEARRATAEAVGRNGVEGRVEVSDRSLEAVLGPFDLVLANLDGSTLEERAEDLTGQLAMTGVLVISGMLTERRCGVLEPFLGLGLGVVGDAVADSWSCVELARTDEQGGDDGAG